MRGMASRRYLQQTQFAAPTAAFALGLTGWQCQSTPPTSSGGPPPSIISESEARREDSRENPNLWLGLSNATVRSRALRFLPASAVCEPARADGPPNGTRPIGLRDYMNRLGSESESDDARGAAPSVAAEDDADGRPNLSTEESRLVRTFDRAAPSVAHVQTTAVVRTNPFSMRATEVPAGTGSGIVWDSSGHVVTNYHVIAAHGQYGSLPGQRVLVKCQGMAEPLDATVVGADPEKDIAVLKISRANGGEGAGGQSLRRRLSASPLPPPITVGTSANLRVGQTVLAIGNPFGLDRTLTTGVVSALGRDVQGAGGRPIHGCVQTDAAINPGNSGGPLLDSHGRLVGVNVAIYSPGGTMGNVGIGFAIPIDTVKRVVDQIIRHGRVVRPTLGVNVADDRIVRSIMSQLGRRQEGALVVEVLPKSPAERAGIVPSRVERDGTLELGDLIVEVDGRPVAEVEDLLSAIEERRNGEQREDGEAVRIHVLRQCDPSRRKTLTARLDVGGDEERPARRGFIGRSNL